MTLAILPLAGRTSGPERRLDLLDGVDKRFAARARASVPAAGVSGFYLLFVAEPLFLRAWFRSRALFVWALRLHIVLLAASTGQRRRARVAGPSLMDRDIPIFTIWPNSI